jgi:hypothetical protein
MTHNGYIVATKLNNMTVTNLGLWYVQSPSGIVVNPLGQIVEPTVHNRSACIIKNRVRVPVSKLPHLTKKEAMEFKEIFYY